MSHQVYLALGTNLGDRRANLQSAIAALPPDVHVENVSQVYETPPWGYLDQPAFLNQVLETATDLPPLELLEYIKRLESELGRTPNFRYGPRLIDLDIIFYDDLVIDYASLVIPHPRLAERAFVLVPLLDLAPDFIHPLLGESIESLAQRVDCTGVVPYQP
jgi:2-amino-4-hydroxy-6-hydroxymethyldihydropteridine diphosphokinase